MILGGPGVMASELKIISSRIFEKLGERLQYG